MSNWRWILFGVVTIALLGVLVFVSRGEQIDVSDVDASQIVTEGVGRDNVKGNPDAEVVVFEYGDFQCPGCAGAYPALKAVSEEYSEDVAFVYRHFPLTSIHPNALAAAAVAEAAGKQGKFYEMHDLLYENQSQWESVSADQRTSLFETYASQLELDIAQYNEDLRSDEVSQKISFDRALGGKIGVTGTPSIFIGETELSEEATGALTRGDASLLRAELNKLVGEPDTAPDDSEE